MPDANTPDAASPVLKKASPVAKPGPAPAAAGPEAQPLHVVGIGASAGGLEALESFFEHMPPDSGAAFVVVQHLSPDFASMMDEILSRRTSMPIITAEHEMAVEPDIIYLLPPKMMMVIADGKLLLTERDTTEPLHLPIDIFLRSLAHDCGSRAIAVILSGSGGDGAHGVVEVHDAGGLVMVQDINSAKFDSMPNAAIATSLADLVLNPEAMPEAILRHIADSPPTREPGDVPDEGEYAKIFALLQEDYGIDFKHYRPATVARRIQRRMALGNFAKVEDYTVHLKNDMQARDMMYKDLLIGVTRFFRTPEAFDFLAQTVIPNILSKAKDGEEVRIWVSGCATGEEVYSVAMLFMERLEKISERPPVKIFATDIHTGSLEIASTGVYSEESMANVSARRRERFFRRTNAHYQVVPELRQMAVFSRHDVINAPPFTKIDLLICRNLLIYLQPTIQKKVLSLFHFALRPGGILFLGPSETLGELDAEFKTLNRHSRIYTKVRDVRLSPYGMGSQGLALTGRQVILPHAVTQLHGERKLLSVYDALLEKLIPPGFLLNDRREILHTFGDASRLLRHHGRTSLDILNLVQGDLRIALSTAVSRALKEKGPVAYGRVKTGFGDSDETVSLRVEPLFDKRSGDIYLHVAFEPAPVAKPAPGPDEDFHLDKGSRLHMQMIEDELKYAKENLQATVEELETSNEELQAANEELVTANEELQSTNEELHSVNQELYTVNTEYENKIGELLQLNRDIDNLLKSTEIGTIFLDKKLQIRKFTPSATVSFNLMPQDIGRPIQHIATNIIGDEEMFERAREVLQSGKGSQKEVHTADGVWLLKRILPYRTESGTIDGVLITFVDITRIKKAEEEYRRSEEKFRSVFEQSLIGMALVDQIGTILDVNQSLCEILGLARERLLSMCLDELAQHREAPVVKERCRMVLAGEQDKYQADVRLLGKDGKTVWAKLTFSRWQGREDQPYSGIGMIEDISEQKRIESEIISSKEQAEAANCAKSEFLANMSHEIRTPISGILGMAALLSESGLGEEEKEYLDMIQVSAQALLGIVNDILDMSKIEAQKLELDIHEVQLDDLLASVVNSFSIQAKDKGIEIRLSYGPGVPHAVLTDSMRLTQILNNLVSNALKFTDQGTISLSVRKTAESAGTAFLEFAVTDTGIGIAPEQRPKLFQPFSQADSSYSKRYGGTGLGLVISKRLVELMGGSIWVESEPGRGSTFSFTLRAKIPESPAGRPAGSATDIVQALNRPAPLNFLLAEDNKVNQVAISKLLGRAGHKVMIVSNGREALEAIKRERFDLVFMDVQMPVLDGLEATQAVRADPDRQISQMPIIAFTAYAMDHDKQKFLAAGMNDILLKPVDVRLLIPLINKWLPL